MLELLHKPVCLPPPDSHSTLHNWVFKNMVVKHINEEFSASHLSPVTGSFFAIWPMREPISESHLKRLFTIATSSINCFDLGSSLRAGPETSTWKFGGEGRKNGVTKMERMGKLNRWKRKPVIEHLWSGYCCEQQELNPLSGNHLRNYSECILFYPSREHGGWNIYPLTTG